MLDRFKRYRKTLDSVADNAQPVIPSDAEPLPEASRALYIGTGGDITLVLTADTNPVTLKNVPAGMLLPVRVKQVLATGTTASDLVALL